jgi:alanine racemase
MPPDLPPATLRLKIDREALAANWRALDRLSGSAKAGAAVKANAYGLGVAGVASTLLQAGCEDFFVAHWQEVQPLLAHVAPAQVSVLHGPLNQAEAGYARALGVRPVINSVHQAQLWLAAGGGPCDLMVDTGINRLGLPMAQIGDPAIAALDLDVMMSHLASADAGSPLNECQRQRWQDLRGQIPHRRASLANSAGVMLGAAFHGDLTRPGIALFGGVPCAALVAEVRQVAFPEAALIQVRDLQAGDSVGYNETYVTDRPRRVGVVSLGYADGYLGCWSGKGSFRSGVAYLPVLGRVSMDMTVIDLTNAPTLREGDWIAADYDLPTAAAISGLGQYELLTVLGKRFTR